jgi:hypothetical protein
MKALFRLAQTSMLMDEAVWARHANPWSVYSRMTLLPLLALAVWSRVWLSEWALVPVTLCVLWGWINPRLFAPPKRTDCWACEGTFGERAFLADDTAAHSHRTAVAWLTVANAVGFGVLAWGLVALNPWITLWGLTTTMGAKLWTFDRMVWLYRDKQRDVR